jgi:hypothetical protein
VSVIKGFSNIWIETDEPTAFRISTSFEGNGTVSMIHLSVVQQASRRIRHHPPANFDSCSTG